MYKQKAGLSGVSPIKTMHQKSGQYLYNVAEDFHSFPGSQDMSQKEW